MSRMLRAEFRLLVGFLSWLVQLMAAPSPILVCLVVANLASWIAPWIDDSIRTAWGFYLFAVVPSWILSFLLAVAVHKIFPTAAVFGRRIWILPTALTALGFCWDAASISPSFAFAEFSSLVHHRAVVLLITYPTVSAIAYSLGMVWSARHQTSKASATSN